MNGYEKSTQKLPGDVPPPQPVFWKKLNECFNEVVGNRAWLVLYRNQTCHQDKFILIIVTLSSTRMR